MRVCKEEKEFLVVQGNRVKRLYEEEVGRRKELEREIDGQKQIARRLERRLNKWREEREKQEQEKE